MLYRCFRYSPRLLKNLVSRRLAVWRVIHRLPQTGKFLVNLVPSTVLISQRPVICHAMPRVVRKIVSESELGWRIELLARNSEHCGRHVGGQLFRPTHGGVFDGHSESICLELYQEIKLHVLAGKRGRHILAQIVVRRTKREARHTAAQMRSWL